MAWRLRRLFDALRRDLIIVFERQPGELHFSSQRKDEFGPIAQAMDMFRSYAAMVDQMQAQQTQMRQQAEEERQRALSDMAETVERETSTAMGNISQESAHVVCRDSQDVAESAQHARR